MAFFIRNKYRTSEIYLSDALQRHKRSYKVHAPLLTQVKASERAAKRGRGPPDRKDPLDFPDAVKLSDTPRMTCIATWFFMREDELEKANIQDVITSVGKLGLLFPIRKADQECGFRAFRDCICKGRPSRSWWCPPCALRSQQLERRQELSALGFLGEDLGKQPLFAGRKSSRITKEEVVRGIEAIATRQGVPLVKNNGRRRFGGHTYRITGAVFSFMTGATDQEVADLGGWRSIEIMKKYLRGVPFSRTSSVSTRLADAVDSGARTSCREEALQTMRFLQAEDTYQVLPCPATGETWRRAFSTKEASLATLVAEPWPPPPSQGFSRSNMGLGHSPLSGSAGGQGVGTTAPQPLSEGGHPPGRSAGWWASPEGKG